MTNIGNEKENETYLQDLRKRNNYEILEIIGLLVIVPKDKKVISRSRTHSINIWFVSAAQENIGPLRAAHSPRADTTDDS